MAMLIVGLADSAERHSTERSVAESAIGLVSGQCDLSGAVYDLRDIGPSLAGAKGVSDMSCFSRAAIEAIRSAELLILTPSETTDRFSPQFQHLLAMLGAEFLAQVPIFTTLPNASAADFRHDRPAGKTLLRWVDGVLFRARRFPAPAALPVHRLWPMPDDPSRQAPSTAMPSRALPSLARL